MSDTNIALSTVGKKPAVTHPVPDSFDWAPWLLELDTEIKKLGYKQFNQHLYSEDFSYAKSFYENNKAIYQITLLIYDFRKHMDEHPHSNKINITYECMLLCDDRIDLVVCQDLSVLEFEEMSKHFYDSMKDGKYIR